MDRPTVASLLTPAGSAAIAVIGIVGPRAAQVLLPFEPASKRNHIPRPTANHLAPGQLRFGYWNRPDGTREEVVVVRRAVDRFELHCHGGPVLVECLLSDLNELGCQIVPWQDFFRAFISRAWEQQVWELLSQSRTVQAAACVLDQAAGALERELRQVAQLLEKNDRSAAQRLVDELVERGRAARGLFVPWHVTLVGPANVGKSSLCNALVGFERTIVWDQPGTTRDVVSADIALDGWLFCVHDVAGLRATDDPVERLGVERAQDQAAQSDLVLFVTSPDVGPWPPVNFPTNVKVLRILNKVDLLENPQKWLANLEDSAATCASEILLTSARTGQGLGELQQALIRTCAGRPLPPNAGVPLTEPLLAELATLRALIDEQHVAAAHDRVTRLAAEVAACWKVQMGAKNSQNAVGSQD